MTSDGGLRVTLNNSELLENTLITPLNYLSSKADSVPQLMNAIELPHYSAGSGVCAVATQRMTPPVPACHTPAEAASCSPNNDRNNATANDALAVPEVSPHQKAARIQSPPRRRAVRQYGPAASPAPPH